MMVVIKKGGIKALPNRMMLIELFRFLGVELSNNIYTHVSERGVIDENFFRRTLTRKELKKEEKQKKSDRGKGRH